MSLEGCLKIEPHSPSLNREEIEALRVSIERVLADECGSLAIHAFIDGDLPLDEQLWSRAAELGWISAALPEDCGGLGLGPIWLFVLHSELGRRAAPGPFIATLSVALWLAEVGPEDYKSRFLHSVANGELTSCIPAIIGTGLSLAPNRASVSGQIDVLGSEDAGLIVAPVGQNGVYDAWALLRPDGVSGKLQRKEFWDRTREICTLMCMDAPVVGLLPDPRGLLERRLRRYVELALAADSLGGAQNISLQTVEYLKTRIQFDRPVASFQAIKHRAANMVARIANQQHLLEHAVDLAVRDTPDADMWAALAKAGASETFAFVSGDCIQLHGGVGHTWEFDPHIFAKRARLNEALAADNMTLLDFAAGELAEATRLQRVTTELGL